MAAETLTREQQEAARKAKAETERVRRNVKKAGLKQKPGDLTAEQKTRAADPPGGIMGKALATFILEGKTGTEQAKEAKEKREAEERQTGAPGRKRTPRDPEAAKLAEEAAALAPDVKSAFLPADARAFMELAGRREPIALLDDVGQDQLAKFAINGASKGEEMAAVRGALKELGKGTRLWGRKLGLFILAAQARREKK